MGRRSWAAAMVMTLATVRTWFWSLPEPASEQVLPALETHLPSLATAPWPELAMLPGFGPRRARQWVRVRARLGPVLQPGALPLVAGIGDTTAQRVQEWYQSWIE